MQRLWDSLRLTRAINCGLAAAGVMVGAYMTWVEPTYLKPILAALVTMFTCAAGNAMNDLLDIRADRMNHPERVLVTGALSKQFAKLLAVGSATVALVLAVFVNLDMLVATVAAMALLAAYNLGLKNLPVAGNVVVAILGGMTFLVGGMAVDPVLVWVLPGPLIPAVFAVFFHLVREIVKDAHDMEGDRVVGASSVPLTFGVATSMTVALVLFAVLTLLTIIPVAEGWFGAYYKIIAVYLVDLPLLAILIFVWGNPTVKMLSIGAMALKVGMALGVVALLVA